jgi:hypothetical protein
MAAKKNYPVFLSKHPDRRLLEITPHVFLFSGYQLGLGDSVLDE